MGNGNDRMQSAPLLPPNSPTITKADRSGVYATIGRELNNILASYHPDGSRRNSWDLTTDLEGLVEAVSRLRGLVNDPADILGKIGSDLVEFTRSFRSGVSNDVETMWNDPEDRRDQAIRLSDGLVPPTADHDPNPDPWYPAPNPIVPHRSRELRASARTPNVRDGAADPPAPVQSKARLVDTISRARLADLGPQSGSAPGLGTSKAVSFDGGGPAPRKYPQSFRVLSRRIPSP